MHLSSTYWLCYGEQVFKAENGGLSERCLGFIGDSESANLCALRVLEAEYPFLCNFPCQAHLLSNLAKVRFWLLLLHFWSSTSKLC